MAKGKGKKGEDSSSNNGDVAEDKTNQALFLDHFAKITEQRKKADKANSDLRNLYKKAKADGFTKKEIDYAVDLMKDEDDKMVQERLRQQQIARWMGHKIGTQGELFEAADRTPILEKAKAEGFRAGSMGAGSSTCPYEGQQGQEWLKGWHEAQDTLKQAFIDKNQRPDTELHRTLPPDAPRGEYDDAMPDADEAGETEEGDEVIQESGSYVDQIREVTGQGEALQREQIDRSKDKSLN